MIGVIPRTSNYKGFSIMGNKDIRKEKKKPKQVKEKPKPNSSGATPFTQRPAK